MAEAILLSGKRGEGKSISAARMMAEYIRRGAPVATNMDIRMERMARPWSQLVCYRLPDHPTVEAFEALPLGNPNPVNEAMNGLLVLDEVGTFLNSRDWQAKDRAAVISWLLHSRKKGWDLLLIAQHPRLVDAQIRDALCELSATARRADKLVVPLIGPAWKLVTGKPMKLPRAHVVTFRYGFLPHAPKVNVWWFSGADYHDCYDSLQKISPEGQQGVSSYLPAWHLKGRYMSKIQMYRGVGLAAFAAGLLFGGSAGFLAGVLDVGQDEPPAVVAATDQADRHITVRGVMSEAGRDVVVLSDGRIAPARASRFDQSGVAYQVGEQWFRRER